MESQSDASEPAPGGAEDGVDAPPEDRRRVALALLVLGELASQAAVLSSPREPDEQAISADRIHKLRIATRRARSALRTFKGTLPSGLGASLGAHLKWLAEILGVARDLDVYETHYLRNRDRLPDDDALALGGYERYLQTERAKARTAVATALRSERFRRLVAGLEAHFPSPVGEGVQTESGRALIRNAGRARIQASSLRILRRGRRIDRQSAPADLHELRKDIKRLRYLLELLEPYFGRQLARTRRAAVRLQDVLGAYQDACAADARTRAYLATAAECSSPDEWFSLGRLAEMQRRMAVKTRKRFDKAWRDFDSAMTRLL
jgi:CHAD domain-containing protein